MELLKNGERLDDLQYKGMKLIQNPEYYCFTSDAVALANYVRLKGKVCEFCAGSGVISLLVVAKNGVTAEALELQPCMADVAVRNVKLNGLEDKIKVRVGDVKDAQKIYGTGVFDAVVVNPPYMKAGSGEGNESEVRRIARHEVALSIEDVAVSASKVLRYGGELDMVHRADRLAEIVCTLKTHGLETKEITYLPASRNTLRVIVRAVKGGNPGVKTDVGVVNPDGTLSRGAIKFIEK